MRKPNAFSTLKLALAIGSVLIGGATYAQTKIIPGWEWNPPHVFPTPEQACQYAISQSEDKGWSYYDVDENPHAPSPRSKSCRATHVSYEDFIYIYAFIYQAPYPTPEPLYVENIEPSGLLSCNRYRISISGPGATQALPSINGPVNLDISVNSNDGPVKSCGGHRIDDRGNLGELLGVTGNNGILTITFVPPYFIGISEHIVVGCQTC